MFGWLRKRKTIENNSSGQSSTVTMSNMQSLDDLFKNGLPGVVSPETAMRHAAVFACVRIIAGAISSLPLQTYSVDNAGDRQYDPKNPIARNLKLRPNIRMSAAMFWRQIVAQMLLRGNGIAWIERKRSGEVIALWPIPFNRTSITMRDGRLRYRLVLDDGTQVVADQDDVLHFPGSMEWNGFYAKTPIEVFETSVGIGLEANRYAYLFFKNDATPGTYITYDGKFEATEDQVRDIRENYKRVFGGDNRHGNVLVLENGGKIGQLEIKASDAQLLETRQFQVIDIARIFGVPPHLIGSTEKNTALGSSVEQQNIAFIQHTLTPHLEAIEQEIDEKLHRSGNSFSEFDVNGLMKGDIKARFEAYRLALGGSSGPGFMKANEIRRSENLPPVEGGDSLVGWSAQEQKGRDSSDEQVAKTSGQ
jgi:phage portal protein, HK97 family